MTEIRRIPGKAVKVGEKQVWCCSECGGTASSWRYKDPALNGHDGRPLAVITHWEKDGARGTFSSYPDAPCVSYYNCHPDAKTKVEMRDVTKWERGWTEVKCCNEWLRCDGFTNTCGHCGADYNSAGQRLADRSQWGEETGESLSDILNIP